MIVISISVFSELLIVDVNDVVADYCVLIVFLDEDADDDVDAIFGFDGCFLLHPSSNSLKGNLTSRLFSMS